MKGVVYSHEYSHEIKELYSYYFNLCWDRFYFWSVFYRKYSNYILPILPWALLVSVIQLAFNMAWGFYQNNRAEKIKRNDKLEQEKTKKRR